MGGQIPEVELLLPMLGAESDKKTVESHRISGILYNVDTVCLTQCFGSVLVTMRIRIQLFTKRADSDPGSQINADPCGSGS